VVTSSSYLDLCQFSSSLINSNGPLLLGIGFVPVSPTYISSYGLATVNAPGYPINVKDSPFGGVLTPLINWQLARSAVYGATHYTIQLNNKYQTSPFGDFLWTSNVNNWVYTLTNVVSGTNAFPLRNYGQLWLNYWWGGSVDTNSWSSGLFSLVVSFGTLSGNSFVQSYQIVQNIQIDNTYPVASINQIYYYDDQSQLTPVHACDIVTGHSTQFAFSLTASDNYLYYWSLGVIWGLNQGVTVASDTYSPNHVPNPDNGQWPGNGITNALIPSNAPYWNASQNNDYYSTHCAHSFILNVWDRAINGFSYIHSATFTESLTFNVGN